MRNLLLLKPIDNKDDRTEIFHLLTKLTAEERVKFLEWARDTANAAIKLRHEPPWVLVEIQHATGDPVETYMDVAAMISTWGLDVNAVTAELERRASEKKLWLPG
ncbi:MAG: hypothetical protein IT428_19885 [Planctomycetaceae bacterium]|nr:hypothetical protein [Planctomycetaceae bacterium]